MTYQQASQILNISLEVIQTLSIIFILCCLWTQSKQKSSQVVAVPAAMIEPAAVPTVAVVEQVVTSVDYSGLGVVELRNVCKANGIVWRNHHGKNKHMTKAEMLKALEGING